jgi:hypothetical protein
MLGEFLTAGIPVIDTERYRQFFSPLIRQSRLTFDQVLQEYRTTVIERFPIATEESFGNTSDLEKPFFVLQMAETAAKAAAVKIRNLEEKAKQSEKERKELDFLRRKQAKKAKKGRKGKKGGKSKRRRRK